MAVKRVRRENRRRERELWDRPRLSSVLTPVWDGGSKQGRWKECLHSKTFLLRGLLASQCTPLLLLPLLLLTLCLWPIALTSLLRDFLTGRRKTFHVQWEWGETWASEPRRVSDEEGYVWLICTQIHTRMHSCTSCFIAHSMEFDFGTNPIS